MNPPGVDARRFLIGCGLGALLGLLYGVLRLPRQKKPHLCDLVFMTVTFYVWLYFSFGVCQGDVRLVYSLSLLLGTLTEEWTLGRLLRPNMSILFLAMLGCKIDCQPYGNGYQH